MKGQPRFSAPGVACALPVHVGRWVDVRAQDRLVFIRPRRRGGARLPARRGPESTGGDGSSSGSTGGSVCGDGTCDRGEEGNCPADCESATTGVCGDGNVDASEACDATADAAECDADCTTPLCGDGHVNAAAGEQCDDGPDNSDEYSPAKRCNAACAGFAAHCGDGTCQGADEHADDCPSDCAASCGNGVTEPGETCDDGNNNTPIDTGTCDKDCTATMCGDLYVNTATESCDDGNASDFDACTNACVAAKCGDGLVWEGMEDCDDGNQVDGDACSNACVASRRIFITSATFKGDLKPAIGEALGVALGDAHCQELADAAGLDGTFLAWLSDGRMSPATRFDTAFAGSYRLVDGTAVVVAGWADLTDGTLAHAIDRDEQGGLAAGDNVWTNTAADGTSAGASGCLDWNSVKVTDKGTIGISDAVDMTWTSVVETSCNGPARLYCVEQ
jgi:cysteine-rich repeat protein